MPAESPSVGTSDNAAGTPSLPPLASLKCFSCGAASLGPTDGVIYFGETIERVCAACVREQAPTPHHNIPATQTDMPGTRSSDRAIVFDLARLQGARRASRRCRATSSVTSSPSSASSSTPLPPVPDEPEPPLQSADDEHTSTTASKAVAIPKVGAGRKLEPVLQAKSVPVTTTHPWTTASTPSPPSPEPTHHNKKSEKSTEEPERPANPLLDVGRLRQRSKSRGPLYPGSIFRGTQRSGRSAYEVEIKIADVNFDDWTLSGYLTIEHLTDSHPHLTTFFDGEIIGPKYGFLTGQRFGASEVDDRRHWERFEQYLRPATKADIVRPEMLLRDPLPDKSRGETSPRERDFVFIRIKEKFLVPDHRQRDISGASFAGFYYAMVDMSPTMQPDEPSSPIIGRPGARRQSTTGTVNDSPRRMSTSLPTRPDMPRRSSTSGPRPDAPRRQSSSRPTPQAKEATIRGVSCALRFLANDSTTSTPSTKSPFRSSYSRMYLRAMREPLNCVRSSHPSSRKVWNVVKLYTRCILAVLHLMS